VNWKGKVKQGKECARVRMWREPKTRVDEVEEKEVKDEESQSQPFVREHCCTSPASESGLLKIQIRECRAQDAAYVSSRFVRTHAWFLVVEASAVALLSLGCIQLEVMRWRVCLSARRNSRSQLELATRP
jgi:hypothetical protein